MSLLKVEKLTVSFYRQAGFMRRSRIDCVSNISVEVARGEVLALIGASGAGKSLLAHAIMGLLPDQATVGGSICFDGRVLERSAQVALRGRRIALIPQSISHLDPLATVNQQIRWAARRACQPMTVPGAHEKALSRFGLEPAVGHAFPHMLSGGMARRVMLAMTTASDADLVIADEPSNGLDNENARQVFRCLKSFAEAGKAVLIISHDLSAVLKISDRVIIIRDGQIEAQEEADAFSGSGDLLSSSYSRAVWNSLPQNGFLRAHQNA